MNKIGVDDFVAGLCGGTTGLLVGHPFDTVRVRLQTDGMDGKRQYRGAFHCCSEIMKKEQFRGFYKGLAPPLYCMAAINAIIFWVYGRVMGTLQSRRDLPEIKNSFISGATAGAAQTVVCCPMELIKLRLQLQSDASLKVYDGVGDAVRKIYREGGIRGLNKGFGVTLWREVPGFATYFATYDFFCQWMVRRKEGRTFDDLSPSWICLAGGMSGILAWIVSYPFDVVKARIQVDGMWGDSKYHGMVDCSAKGYREEGVRVFVRGMAPTLIRAFPVNAVTFTTVALVLRFWPWRNIADI